LRRSTMRKDQHGLQEPKHLAPGRETTKPHHTPPAAGSIQIILRRFRKN
jgi:hypothetical protein